MRLQFLIASLEDHDAVYSLMLEAFQVYVRKLGGKSGAGPYPWLEPAIQRGEVYLAKEDDKIVGVVTTAVEGEDLAIGQIGVDPSKQGEGIGSWLIQQVEKVAREKNLETLSLETAEIMTDLLRLYERHGFKEVKRAPPAHEDDRYLRVYMSKRL